MSISMQMWACKNCGAERQWGFGAWLPKDNMLEAPQLRCAHECMGRECVTEHKYAGLEVRKQ